MIITSCKRSVSCVTSNNSVCVPSGQELGYRGGGGTLRGGGCARVMLCTRSLKGFTQIIRFKVPPSEISIR